MASLSFARDADPILFEIDNDIAKAAKTGNQELFQSITERLVELNKERAEDPGVLSVSGLHSLFCGNVSSALYKLARATHLDPSGFNQKPMIELILSHTDLSVRAEELIQKAAQSWEETVQEKAFRAADLIAADRFTEADKILVELLALQAPFRAQPSSFEALKEASELEQEQVEGRFFEVGLAQSDLIAKNEERFEIGGLTDPQKMIAEKVKEIMKNSPKGLGVDFRCHMPVLLSDLLAKSHIYSVGWEWIGFDDREALVQFAKKHFPHLKIERASFLDQSFEGLSLSRHIDLALVSSVFCFLSQNRVRRFLKLIKPRVRSLLIADEISNCNGELTLKREERLLHPFEALLSEAGFEIRELKNFDRPQRGSTGYILADVRV